MVDVVVGVAEYADGNGNPSAPGSLRASHMAAAGPSAGLGIAAIERPLQRQHRQAPDDSRNPALLQLCQIGRYLTLRY